jgi:nucleoid DNA-binding protein
MESTFIIAFKEVLREQFIEKNRVEIDGLGEFEVKHHEQHQKTFDSGKVVLMPPADVVEFKSNIKHVHED